MFRKPSALLPLAILLTFCAVPGKATLVGTSVTGSLTFSGDPSNYFDPGYGFVPTTGYLNISGTTVKISSSAVEFGFDDGASLISANFSDNQLTINDTIQMSGPNNGFQMVFTDSAFAGQYLSLVSDSFPIARHSVVGDVMTLDYAGGTATTGRALAADFLVTPVPEPSTFGGFSLLMVAALAVFFSRRYRLRWLHYWPS